MKRLTQIFQALLGAAAIILASLIAAGRLAWRIICKWWKKSSKWIRIILWSILAIIAMFFAGCYIKYLYDSKYGRDYWDREVSENVSLYSFADGTYRVYSHTTDQYTTGKINWLSETAENDNLAVYAKPGKRGYIDVNSGNIVIDADSNSYSKAWIFSEGMAAVMKDGKIGFINKKNEVVIPFIHEWSDEYKSWDFGYAFHNGNCVMTIANGNVGLIDTKGEWITQPVYDEIWQSADNGYRITRKDSYFGVLDSTGCEVYPATYDCIDMLPDGFILTKDGTMQQVDLGKNIIKPFMFDGTYWLNYPVGYNENGEIKYEFAEYAKYKVMYLYGIMNRITGKPITPAIYEDINMLTEGLFEVQDPISYDWHLLDKNGKEVIKE